MKILEFNKPIVLDNKIYRIKSGKVNLFLLHKGRRIFVNQFDEGEIITGSNLLAIGLYDTSVAPAKASSDEIYSFFSKISSNLSSDALKTSKLLDKPGEYVIAKGLSFVSNEGLIGDIKSGSIEGISDKKVLVSKLPLVAEDTLQIKLERKRPTQSEIERFLDGYISLLKIKADNHEHKTKVTFKKKIQMNYQIINNAILKLLYIAKPPKDVVHSYTDPGLRLLEIAASNMGVDLPDLGILEGRENSFEDGLRLSGILKRDVLLEEDWFSKPGSAIYARSGEKDYVLVYKKGGYRAYSVDKEIEVDNDFSSSIDMAQMLYPPFPNKKLTLFDIVTFNSNKIKKDMIVLLAISLLAGLLSMVVPIVTGRIFDIVVPSADVGSLVYIFIFLILVAFLNGAFFITRSIAALRSEGKIDFYIQSAIWNRLLSLPISFFKQYSSSDLSRRANGIITIRDILSGAVLSGALTSIFTLFQLGLIFSFSLSLGFLAIALSLPPIIVMFIVGRIKVKLIDKIIASSIESSHTMLQIILGINKFKIIGGEDRAFNLWSEKFYDQKTFENREESISNMFSLFNVIYPIIVSTIVFWYISRNNSIGIGRFMAFQAAFSSSMSSMIGLASTAISVLKVIPIYQRAKPILDAIPEVDINSKAVTIGGSISLSNVKFRYGEDYPLVLEDIDMDIEPGDFVAIVGGSGSGKSTIMKLMLGFYEPEDGFIYYDDKNIRDLNLPYLRSQLGVVLQNGKLLPGSIFENITGPFNLSLDEAWLAAEAAGIADDIREMPMGMHTLVSENSSTLSGGQQQRIMIARSIVNNPKVIFFDEATSALDNITQSIVMESLLRVNSTKIVVAHRLSTIKNADKIYVVDKGKIVEVGRYNDLMKREGKFYELVKRQQI